MYKFLFRVIVEALLLTKIATTIMFSWASYVPGTGCLTGPTVWVRVTAYLGWMSEKIGQGKSSDIFCQKI